MVLLSGLVPTSGSWRERTMALSSRKCFLFLFIIYGILQTMVIQAAVREYN